MQTNFTSDHRASNPGLHALYVKWAVQTLKDVREALEKLEGRSKRTASRLANALRIEMQDLIAEDAAFFDAAAILFSGVDTTPYYNDDEQEQV